jgi:acetylornithine/succinyldiaminopimelate/putrescine aminotransferase
MFDLKALLDQHPGEELALVEQHINPAFAKVLRILGYDLRYVRGQGCYLWDDRGRRYIDCLGGYAVFNCGRNHPVIREALKQCMDLDLPNLIKMGTARLSGLLAEQLVKLAPGDLDTVFFTNSGAEGIETAIKYARAATARPRILFTQKAFHGLTLGALSVNGNAEFRDGFGLLLNGCDAVPFNDPAALERELAKGDVAGFIVEPIQGKGVAIASPEYLPEVQRLCRQHKTLFIADEVQTGFGRTGKMFACEHWNVEPDILVVAKGLSGGYIPTGAVISKRWIHERVFSSLDRCVVHSTTFGQNDMAMAAGLATLHVLKSEKLVENAAAMGDLLLRRLRDMGAKYEMFKEVRGKGLMIALEFKAPSSMALRMGWNLLHKLDESLFCQAILIPLLTDHHVLAQVAGHHIDVIKLIPPLTLNAQDVEDVTNAFDAVIAACHKFPGPVWEVGKRLGSNQLKRREPAAV